MFKFLHKKFHGHFYFFVIYSSNSLVNAYYFIYSTSEFKCINLFSIPLIIFLCIYKTNIDILLRFNFKKRLQKQSLNYKLKLDVGKLY